MGTPEPDDPYLWLEEVLGERALDWVRAENARAQAVLEARPEFAPLCARILAILESKDRIPDAARFGDWLYDCWRDATHRRGLWRRTTLAEYRKPDTEWQALLDIDALAEAEGEPWVPAGFQHFGPGNGRVLISLSRGGADAAVVREFDIPGLGFVTDGFTLPEAKSDVTWLDADTLLVGTDFGPGSLTASGYPRVIRRWRRGTPLAAAETVFEAEPGDVAASAGADLTPGHERVTLARAIDFYTDALFELGDGGPVAIDKPADAGFGFWRDHVLIRLRSDWRVGGRDWPAGSLLVAGAAGYLAGARELTALFTPTASATLQQSATTRDAVLLVVLDTVASRLEEWRLVEGAWVRRAVATPFPGTLSVAPMHDGFVPDDPLAERYLLGYTDFLTPTTLMLGETGSDAREVLKAAPATFDAAGMRAEQRFAASADGTRVPYFVIWPSGAAEDGANPTLLTGYGGFEVPMLPHYEAVAGPGWLARGGVLVVANTRGGGEFGPAWHKAAMGAAKQRSYDDFVAVAEDLVARGVTSPARLGIAGGSNGGLMVAAVMLQRPELFGAVVCQVPLTDMRRFHKLLAGASWVAEYGDPDDPAAWEAMRAYSPYHNVRAGARYPRVLFTTSTRDDRVHPGHARKMAARMRELGHDLLYYENVEGGHGGAADNAQRAHLLALEYAFLWMQLGR